MSWTSKFRNQKRAVEAHISTMSSVAEDSPLSSENITCAPWPLTSEQHVLELQKVELDWKRYCCVRVHDSSGYRATGYFLWINSFPFYFHFKLKFRFCIHLQPISLEMRTMWKYKQIRGHCFIFFRRKNYLRCLLLIVQSIVVIHWMIWFFSGCIV